jgi:hypothetical protein
MEMADSYDIETAVYLDDILKILGWSRRKFFRKLPELLNDFVVFRPGLCVGWVIKEKKVNPAEFGTFPRHFFHSTFLMAPSMTL